MADRFMHCKHLISADKLTTENHQRIASLAFYAIKLLNLWQNWPIWLPGHFIMMTFMSRFHDYHCNTRFITCLLIPWWINYHEWNCCCLGPGKIEPSYILCMVEQHKLHCYWYKPEHPYQQCMNYAAQTCCNSILKKKHDKLIYHLKNSLKSELIGFIKWNCIIIQQTLIHWFSSQQKHVRGTFNKVQSITLSHTALWYIAQLAPMSFYTSIPHKPRQVRWGGVHASVVTEWSPACLHKLLPRGHHTCN